MRQLRQATDLIHAGLLGAGRPETLGGLVDDRGDLLDEGFVVTGGGRAAFYRAASDALQVLVNEAASPLEAYERRTGQGPWNLAAQLIDDERVLTRLVDVARAASTSNPPQRRFQES